MYIPSLGSSHIEKPFENSADRSLQKVKRGRVAEATGML
jgi:hypothetical protein